MTNNLKTVLGTTLAIGVTAGVIVAKFEGDALADRNDVVLSASADWQTITVRKYLSTLPDGGSTSTMDVTVCGTALLASGEVSLNDSRCDSIDLSGQQTALNNIINSALARWKTKRGL